MTDNAQSDSHDLWCCEPCEMIGLPADARRHTYLTGHKTRKLTDAERDGVVEIWRREDREIPWEANAR